MKATGIIRKIDELGRIVIPKEIRKTLKIHEGDSMEIYVERNGEVILKRYAPLGEIMDQVISYAEVLAQNTGFGVCITDSKSVIAVAGTSRKYLDRNISQELLDIMQERILWQNKNEPMIKITDKEENNINATQVIGPIISDGSVIGTVILFSENIRKVVTESDLKLVQTATAYLSRQME